MKQREMILTTARRFFLYPPKTPTTRYRYGFQSEKKLVLSERENHSRSVFFDWLIVFIAKEE